MMRANAFAVWLLAGILFCAPGLGHAYRSDSSGQAGRSSATAAAAEKELKQAYALRQNLTQRDMEAAIRLFDDSARRFYRSGARQAAAASALEAGDSHQMMSAYREAVAAYRRSIALSDGGPEARCAALARIARTYANMGRNRDAEPLAGQAVSLCSEGHDTAALAYALEVQGEVKFWSADMTGAMASFTRARQLAADSGQREVEAQCTMMMAQVVHDSDRKQADRLTQAALALWAQAGDDYGAARAHLTMAFFAADEGNFALAHCHCERALPVFKRISDKDNEGIVLNTLGMVARQSGDVEAALIDYQQARKDFTAAHDDLGEADSIIGLTGVLLSERDYGALLALCQRETYLAETTNNRGLLASALLNIADLQLHSHHYEQAAFNYQRSLVEYRAAENAYGAGIAYMRLAELRSSQGRFRQALELLDQARNLKEQTGETEDLARICYIRAQVYLRLNELEPARTEIEKTIAVIESQRLRIGKFDSRAQYFSFVHEYYSLYIQVLMELHRLHPNQGYEALAFEAAERSKVRALLDLINDSQETPSCDRLLAGSPDSGARSPASPEVASAQALSLTQIESEINDGQTVLLEYAFGDEHAFAWLVEGDHIRAIDLGPVINIRNTVRAFREALAPLQAGTEEPAIEYLHRRRLARARVLLLSKQLSALLIEPLHLPLQKRVLIVPDGPLQYLPFAAISLSASATRSRPWIAANELTTLPSASVLAILRKTATKRPPPIDEVTVFADPVFETNPSLAASQGVATPYQRSRNLARAWRDANGARHIPSLPGSRREALAIQHVVGPPHTRLALGFDANREAVIDGSIARQRIVHFATHGIMDTRHPEMSGLVLSLVDKQGKYRDGYLRLSDIYRLKLSADLVVLSSCESALGKDLGSEGIIGLPRGFLYAGARSVIASLWKVDDEASATLMSDLYVRMKQGEAPSAALRGAQLDLAKSSRFSDPSFWAAYVLEGDYR